MALSYSLLRRKWLARSYRFSRRSLSSFGMVCMVPQNSHAQVVAFSAGCRSPPHILHLMIMRCILLPFDGARPYLLPFASALRCSNRAKALRMFSASA